MSAAGATERAPELRQVQFAPESGNLRILVELDRPAPFQASIDRRANRLDLTFGALTRRAAGQRRAAGFGLARTFRPQPRVGIPG